MRKAILWVLIAMLALSAIGFAEGVTTQKASVNSHGAVRTATDLYLTVPAPDSGEMLVRVPLAGGEAVCVDRAGDIEDLVAYSGGVAYLASDANASAAKCCIGNTPETLYSFGSNKVSNLTAYGDELLVLNEGLLFSFNPNTQVCLKLSGAQMLDYVLDQDCAYYISESDKMEYTAQLGTGDTASTQAGCIYRLDLASGETTLLLKSGGTDLQLGGNNIYFHNLADAYAVRASEDDTQLCGRLYSLDASLKTLNKECAEPDSGYWIAGAQPVVLYNNALNLMNADGSQELYKPENGSITVTDGDRLYVWEPAAKKLTEVQTSGQTTMLYGQDLSQALDADTLVDVQAANDALLNIQSPDLALAPDATAVPEGEQASGDWFDQFIGNGDEATTLEGEGENPQPTPIPSAEELEAQRAVIAAEGAEDQAEAPVVETPAVPVPIAITNDAVKLREGPGSEFVDICSIPAGVSVPYLGEVKSSKLSTWYQVEYGDETGFIYSDYADLSVGIPTLANAAPAAVPAEEMLEGEEFVDDDLAVEDPFEAALSAGTPAATSASVPASTSKSSGSTKYSTYKISGKYAKIKNGAVNMRTKPGTAFSVITSIPNGATVPFKGLGAKNNDGSKWYQVEYNGKTGWISQKYATITNSKGSSAGSTYNMDGKYVYTTGNVNVRKNPSLDSVSLGAIPAGTYLNFAKKGSTDSRGVQWYKVTQNGKTGWVSSMYSVIKNSKSEKKTGKYVKATGSANLRKGPGLNYGIIGVANSGEKFTYLGASKVDSRGVRWYKVSDYGTACWISSKFSTLIS